MDSIVCPRPIDRLQRKPELPTDHVFRLSFLVLSFYNIRGVGEVMAAVMPRNRFAIHSPSSRGRKRSRTALHVATLFGRVCLKRFAYRCWELKHVREHSIFPLELQLGLREAVTPALACRIGEHAATLPRAPNLQGVLQSKHPKRRVMAHHRDCTVCGNFFSREDGKDPQRESSRETAKACSRRCEPADSPS